MLHIAILFEFPSLNGGERSMLATLQALRKTDDFRFTAIAPQAGGLADELARLDIPVIPYSVRADGRKRETALLHSELRRICGDLQPNVLHANSLAMTRLIGQIDFTALPLLRRTGHLRDIIKLNATVIADMNSNDAMVAVSEATRRYHVNQGLEQDRCRVIYNGVDIEAFQPRPQLPARSALFPNIPSEAKILLNVGQICLRKGQHDLAKAVCKVLTVRDDVHMVIAGERHSVKPESVAFETAIRDEFSAIGRSGNLHMPGFCDNVAALMNASDVLVHAAHQEPFGRTLLEAAASGLPIIATDVGGTSEMLRPDQDALLLTPGNPQAVADTVQNLLSHAALQRALATSARNRIVQKFTASQMASGIASFWQTSASAVRS